MTKFLKDMTEKMNDNGLVQGVVVALNQSEAGEDVVVVETSDGGKVHIDRADMGHYSSKHSLVRYLQQNIFFQIKSIEDQTVFGTRDLVERAETKSALKKLREEKPVKASVISFNNAGAIIRYGTITGLLRHKDFSGKDINISQFVDYGDKLDVVLKAERTNNRGDSLYDFAAAETYEIKDGEGFTAYESGSIVTGSVTGTNAAAMFVNIARGVDVLCSLPAGEEVEVGMEAVVRITVIDEERGRIRGKVIKVSQPTVRKDIEIPKDLRELIDKEGEEIITLEDLSDGSSIEELEQMMKEE